jgi:hypothetical protein
LNYGGSGVWVCDTADQLRRFVSLIPGPDDTALLVLIGDRAGKMLSVEPPSVTSGAIATDPMWRTMYGVQS